MFYWLLLSHRSAQNVPVDIVVYQEKYFKKKNAYPHACCGSLYKCLLSIIDLACYNETNNEDNCASAVIIECASRNVAKIASRNRSAANQNKMEIARFIWEIASILAPLKRWEIDLHLPLFFNESLREKRDELDGYLAKSRYRSHETLI